MWDPIITTASYVLLTLAWAGAGAVATWLIFVLPYRVAQGVRWTAAAVIEEMAFLFFASVLGATVGVMTGLSRQAAIGAVVPSVLTVIAGLIGYLYASQLSIAAPTKFVVVIATVCLAVFFFWGALAGQAIRKPFDRYDRQLELYKLAYQADLEKAKLAYQSQLEREKLKYAAELEAAKAMSAAAQKKR